MSDDKIWAFRLNHILNAIQEIDSFVRDISYEAFMADIKTIRAVERNIEIIGEASSKIPENVKQKNPDVPWAGMKGMRNAISHNYDHIEYESVWDVVKNRLPALRYQLEALRSAMPEESRDGS